MTGAYTTATATDFNFFPRARMVNLDETTESARTTNGNSTLFEEPWRDHVTMRLGLRCSSRSDPVWPVIALDSYDLGKVFIHGEQLTLSEKDGQAYAELMAHPALQCHQSSRVLILGGGDGSVAREVLRYNREKRTIVSKPACSV